jgi:Holliday junction DNA helicase RuvA
MGAFIIIRHFCIRHYPSMITKITGIPINVSGDILTLAVGAFEYEVLIPEFTRRQLQAQIGHQTSLHTIEYLEGNQMASRLTPRLVGFLNPIEREFFELFCQVDGVGVKKALRSMVRPVQEVAALIEDQDAKGLAALPGIGPATAERVIAKLRRKVPKFALLVGRDLPADVSTERDVLSETFDALRALGHSEADARKLLDEALSRKKKYKDVDEMLRAVYEQRHGG